MSGLPRIRLDSRETGGWVCQPAPASLMLRCEAGTGITLLYDLTENGRTIRSWADPLAALRWLEQHLMQARARRLDRARWIGYLGYDLGRLFEAFPPRDLGELPLFVFTFHHEIDSPSPLTSESEYRREGDIRGAARPESNFTRAQYLEAIRGAIEYIRAGDIFQVNLSQRFFAPLIERPEAIYRRLQACSPAVYGGYLDYGDFALLCNSPESFLRVRREDESGRRIVATRPIKGTRPAEAGMDRLLRDSLKDQAELNMIIDLERNDLGRVCEIGSVKVSQPRTIERHPTVYHGVATIEGALRPDVGLVELLRATFPGGSITGAPKIRAMQIIDELEPSPRGPYCGAIGWLDSRGNMEFNIAIRTMIARAGRIEIPVGGGIVADSIPAEEYAETLVKARALFDAVGLARARSGNGKPA